MTGPGSVQLRLYLRARRSGVTCGEAATLADIGFAEARLTDQDEAKGLLADIDLAISPAIMARRLGPLCGTPLGDVAAHHFTHHPGPTADLRTH